MKLTVIFLLAACLQVSATGNAQSISLSVKNATLRDVSKEINRQSGYSLFYTDMQMKNAKRVTIQVKNVSLTDVLNILVKDQPFSYEVVDKLIVLKDKRGFHVAQEQSARTFLNVYGRVLTSDGAPVAAASVQVLGQTTGTTTDDQGFFHLQEIDPDAVLVFSGVNIQTLKVKVNGRSDLGTISVPLKISQEESVVVNAGYYTVKDKLKTGNIERITSREVEMQPVHNPLAALQGRVTGLFVSQVNGLPGANFDVRIRGVNSISQGNDPLFIIDGVPFPIENLAQRGLSNISHPLNTINNADIESIEVLKDADATAIYGSRGANGVILITTKKGKVAQGTRLDVSVYHGRSTLPSTMAFMNTDQYLAMRREAFQNDGLAPNIGNGYDLLLWDSTRNEDWKNVFFKDYATTTDAQARLSGGSGTIRYGLAVGFRTESPISSGDNNMQRGSGDLSVSHHSASGKFSANLSTRYASNVTKVAKQDFFTYLSLPPNTPPPLTDDGNLNWPTTSQLSSAAALAATFREFKGVTDNSNTHLTLEYRPSGHFTFKGSMGFNQVSFQEESINPIVANNPMYSPTGSNSIGSTKTNIWIAEPQAIYATTIARGKLEVLFGTSWQQRTTNSVIVDVKGITDDALIWSASAGPDISAKNGFSDYRYQAVFGRLNYNWANKYLINLTARRDGSSRFGPGKRYANFGAAGLGWIFTDESVFDDLGFLNFGKFRASYGLTGNDQIGDYRYLDTWSNMSRAYDGSIGLRPTRLFNPEYHWELNKKFEVAADLGFFHDRIRLSLSHYRNISDNQLIYYTLPAQSGFGNVLRNFPARVQNTGIEFDCTLGLVKTSSFSWSTNFNITRGRNKLAAFPGLENSSYASSYIIGEPLSVEQGYQFLGVDPFTGIYMFDDKNQDGRFDRDDYTVIGNTDPDFYGGFNNTISFKGFELDVLFQFVKQDGTHPVYSRYGANGGMENLPVLLLDRWRKPGDVVPYQKLTTRSGTPASTAATRTFTSSAKLTDASFVRLKNTSVSYSLPENLQKRLKLQNGKIFIQAQNLLTITDYPGSDPETQNYLRTPPLRVVTFGLQVSL